MDTEILLEGNHRLSDPSVADSYKEALPNDRSIIDILAIDQSGFDFANQWITALFGKKSERSIIQPTLESNRQLENLYFTARNTEKIKGYKNLGFGFPMLAKKDRLANTGFLVAPIFIWDINLEPDTYQEQQWNIKPKSNYSVRVNPLLNDFSSEVSTLIQDFEKKHLSNGLQLKKTIQFCESLSKLLAFENDPPAYKIGPFPDLIDLATIEEEGTIVWSGILASFPPLPSPKSNERILSKEYWKGGVEEDLKTSFQFSYLTCDHQQKAVQIAAAKHNFIFVQGPAGSGKNHAITNLLVNNLVNGRTSLIVGQSVLDLEKIEAKLQQIGFEEFAFLFKNIALDNAVLVEQLAAKLNKLGNKKRSINAEFALKYSRFNKFRNLLNNTASAYSKNIFDINNWTETVGLFLQNNRQEGKELLDTHLSVNEYNFDFIEYESLKEKITKAAKLFKELFAFAHPLDILHNDHFLEKESKVAKSELTAKLNKYLKRARRVQREVLTNLGGYKNALEDYYNQKFQSLTALLTENKDLIDQLQLRYGTEYHKTGFGNLKILKTFSPKTKRVHELKIKIVEQFEKIKRTHFEQPFFDFEFLAETNSGNIDVIQEHLHRYETTLQNWRIRNQVVLQESIRNLNSKTNFKGLKNAPQIAPLEVQIDDLVTEINKSKLFTITYKNNAMTLQLKLQLLEEMIARMSSCLHNLRDFDTIFRWRKLMVNCDALTQRTIQTLIKVRPQNWLAAFDAWYFHNLLTAQSRKSEKFEPLLAAYFRHRAILLKNTPDLVEEKWAVAKIEASKKIKRNGKTAVKGFIKKSTTEKEFETYFKNQISRINQFFPIILMTAEMARKLLIPTKQPIFDNLIIKGCGQLTKDQGGGLMSLTRKVQFFEGQFLDDDKANSFISLANSFAGKHINLKTLHHSKSLPISAFKNVVFEQQLAISFNGNVDASLVDLHVVNGDYDEQFRINEQEARHLLSIISKIEGTPQKTFPKVGFACATIEQRNLLAAYILKIKQQNANGVEKIMHLERNGMGIFAFEELAGHTFDLLVVSLTFGIADDSNRVSREVEIFNTSDGKKQFQSLLNSGVHQMVICHSLPTSFIKSHSNSKRNTGLSILANFLNYASEIQKGNARGLHQILNGWKVEKIQKQTEEGSIFLDQVAHFLSSYFEPERILRNHSVGNKIYPLVIKGNQEPTIKHVILVDNHSNKGEVFSFEWEQVANQQLAAKGYQFITIWSGDWWRQPEEAARKLASQIIRRDVN